MDSASAPPRAPADPLDVLLEEHRTILQVLDEVDRERGRLERDGVLREALWRDVLRFVDEFDGRLHHHKEEDLLFPALEAVGLERTTGPTAVLRDEHRRATGWRHRVEQALVARDRLRLAAAATTFTDLVRGHVLKENQILFPLARRLLTDAQRASLLEAFGPLTADVRARAWIAASYPPTAGG